METVGMSIGSNSRHGGVVFLKQAIKNSAFGLFKSFKKQPYPIIYKRLKKTSPIFISILVLVYDLLFIRFRLYFKQERTSHKGVIYG